MTTKEKATILYKNPEFRDYCIRVAARFGKVNLPASDIVFLFEEYKKIRSTQVITTLEFLIH